MYNYSWYKLHCIRLYARLLMLTLVRVKLAKLEILTRAAVIDILEEMLYLANCDSLQITLLPQTDANK